MFPIIHRTSQTHRSSSQTLSDMSRYQSPRSRGEGTEGQRYPRCRDEQKGEMLNPALR